MLVLDSMLLVIRHLVLPIVPLVIMPFARLQLPIAIRLSGINPSITIKQVSSTRQFEHRVSIRLLMVLGTWHSDHKRVIPILDEITMLLYEDSRST